MRKGERKGNRTVARGAGGELRGLFERRAGHQQLDAFMHVAQALFEARDGFAVGGEAEMAGLDDAGMHRPDRDLVQVFAFHRQKFVGGIRGGHFAARAERMFDAPKAEVEPAPRVGQPHRLEAVEIADRALQADRRRVQRPNRRKPAVPAFEGQHRDLVCMFVEHGHMHCAGAARRASIAPQAEQSPIACRHFIGGE